MSYNESYQNYLRECKSGVLTEVVLTSPDTSKLRGGGVCRIYLSGERFLTPSGSDRVSAFLRPDPPSGRLLVHFLVRSLSPDVRQAHFGAGSLTVEEAYPLGGNVARQLTLDGGDCWIKSGTYPVLDDGELLTVSVRIGRMVALSSSPELSVAA